MRQDVLRTKNGFAIVVTAALLTSCASAQLADTSMQAPDGSTQASAEAVTDATVKGRSEQLKQFHKHFRSLIDNERVGCAIGVPEHVFDCKLLEQREELPAGAWITYRFYAGHTGVLEKLGIAFNRVSSED